MGDSLRRGRGSGMRLGGRRAGVSSGHADACPWIRRFGWYGVQIAGAAMREFGLDGLAIVFREDGNAPCERVSNGRWRFSIEVLGPFRPLTGVRFDRQRLLFKDEPRNSTSSDRIEI
jgi:hypothetical protein